MSAKIIQRVQQQIQPAIVVDVPQQPIVVQETQSEVSKTNRELIKIFLESLKKVAEINIEQQQFLENDLNESLIKYNSVTCHGITKTGTKCRITRTFLDEHGFCNFHGKDQDQDHHVLVEAKLEKLEKTKSEPKVKHNCSALKKDNTPCMSPFGVNEVDYNGRNIFLCTTHSKSEQMAKLKLQNGF